MSWVVNYLVYFVLDRKVANQNRVSPYNRTPGGEGVESGRCLRSVVSFAMYTAPIEELRLVLDPSTDVPINLT